MPRPSPPPRVPAPRPGSGSATPSARTSRTASRGRRRGPARTVRLVAAACLLLGLAVSLRTGWGDVPLWAAPVLAVAVVGTELSVAQLQVGRRRWVLSLTGAALGAALVAGPGAWTVVAVGAGVAVAQRLRHQPRPKRVYDLAHATVATALAAALAGALGGGFAGACAGVAVFWAVGYALVALAVSLTSQRPLRSLIVSSAPLSALHAGGNASIGLLAAHLVADAPLGLVGLAVPLALLWCSYDQQARRGAEARLFAELARGQEREAGRSRDISAQVVVTAAGRLLGGADVELLLLASDGPVRFVGDETGVHERRRTTSDVFDEPWVLRALAERGAHLGRDEGRPYVCAVLGEQGAPLAVMRARRGRDAAAFDRHELRLVRVLAGQAQSWLQVAELAERSQAANERAEVAG